MFHPWPGGGVIFPAAPYDLPETIPDTIRLGKAPMSMEPDLNYRSLELAVSTVKRCSTREDLEAKFHELHWNIGRKILGRRERTV